MATEQRPTNTLASGGQGIVSGWDVLSVDPSFNEIRNVYYNPNGTKKVAHVVSRVKTFTLELQALYGTTAATLLTGGTITYDGVLCEIIKVSPKLTSGPIMCTLELEAQADSIS